MAEGGKLDYDSKCSICLSFYTEPRLLDCYHVFCSPCLEKLIDENSLVCPLCRRQYLVYDAGVGELRSFPFHKTPNDDSVVKCDLCKDENTAMAKCKDCNSNLCSMCHEYHGKMKSWINHKIDLLETQDNTLKTVRDISRTRQCETHKKELTLFCKPCNLTICHDCVKESHQQHEYKELTVLEKESRYLLKVQQTNVRSRMSYIEGTIDGVKQEENAYRKRTEIMKRDLKSHASLLKEIICKAIDNFVDIDLCTIENEKRKSLKIIRTFLDESETKHMSLSCLVKTLDIILSDSNLSNMDLVGHTYSIGSKMEKCLLMEESITDIELSQVNFVKKTYNETKLRDIFGELQIETCALQNVENVKDVQIPLPYIYPPRMLSNFSIHDDSKDINIFGSDNNTAWVITESCARLYQKDGYLIETHYFEESCSFLSKKESGLWIWRDNCVKQLMREDGHHYILTADMVPIYFLRNGNLLVFLREKKVLSEVNEQGETETKLEHESLNSFLRDVNPMNVNMVETRNNNFAMSCKCDKVVFTNKNGKIIYKFEQFSACFTSLCINNYGHILVADSNNKMIYILHEKESCGKVLLGYGSISGLDLMDIDGCGHLWFSYYKEGSGWSRSRQEIQVYSYL